MSDLNVIMLEHARSGLQTQLDAAVTAGDTVAARKISDDLAKLSVQNAPKAPPYGDVEIKAALEAKADWFGTDPRKSGAAIRLGKDMNPKKFATADAFAEALIKAVDEEFKPSTPSGEAVDDNKSEDDKTNNEDKTGDDKTTSGKRRSDAPGASDALNATNKRALGPWTKLSDAPRNVQEEIKRSVTKFVPSGADQKVKDGFIAKALESHYAAVQRTKGK